jgi:tRNA(fMet)-specific endonuclease VapC
VKLDRLAVDSSAAVDFLDDRRRSPPQIREVRKLFLPFVVLGELEYGVLNTPPDFRPIADEKLRGFLSGCEHLFPTAETISHYARVRLNVKFPPNMSRRREHHLLNDLWIAALCVQHKLPLLSNDSDFDGIEGLEAIHW